MKYEKPKVEVSQLEDEIFLAVSVESTAAFKSEWLQEEPMFE